MLSCHVVLPDDEVVTGEARTDVVGRVRRNAAPARAPGAAERAGVPGAAK